jgi:hypothetical protein
MGTFNLLAADGARTAGTTRGATGTDTSACRSVHSLRPAGRGRGSQTPASAPRSVSTTRSWSPRSSRAWNGSAIVRALQSSLTGSIP